MKPPVNLRQNNVLPKVKIHQIGDSDMAMLWTIIFSVIASRAIIAPRTAIAPKRNAPTPWPTALIPFCHLAVSKFVNMSILICGAEAKPKYSTATMLKDTTSTSPVIDLPTVTRDIMSARTSHIMRNANRALARLAQTMTCLKTSFIFMGLPAPARISLAMILGSTKHRVN